MDSIKWAYDFFLSVATTGPLGERVFLVALLASWGAAYFMRLWQPVIPIRTRDTIVGLVQLFVGWGVTFGLWPTAWGFIIGFICGAFAPFVWGALLAVADWKLPALAKLMRGVPSQPPP